jgi:hypothetical protein
MKSVGKMLVVLSAVIAVAAILGSCGSSPPPAESPPTIIVEDMALTRILRHKGSDLGINEVPAWVSAYVNKSIAGVQDLPEYKDHYAIIGEEHGVNLEFVLTWADNFDAQQQIGAMLRTTVASTFTAVARGREQSSGGGNSSSSDGTGSGSYQQALNNTINTLVAATYSGARKEADYWTYTRNYDADQRSKYSDEYIAYVLYVIPKDTLNRQITAYLQENAIQNPTLAALNTSVAEEIMRNGLAWGAPENSGL